MDLNIKIGETIKHLRLKQGKTLEKLAYESDFSKGGLSEVERGCREIKISSLAKLCDTLNISLSDFFKFYEESN